ncbi:CGNR zinc finger domain-containing protein [Microbacterium sp. 13-71-7]|jgi:hypothetical protein|uniref:CGNR zinc finger domain-containing protein n=1 Tax=Microbacterium sp. 13-71-7 TaxID=1970399 RepID=UPI000BD07EC3|nr:CGNR zinc finger domain-containing protein [Microbacterium sp. 13-71-7]OZB83071.1 MAG: hypothetical protein B7X32_11555 [Microbacterium sp. 13-71-7]
MRFDSHVADLLHVSTELVNLLTSEEVAGRTWSPPEGADRRRALGVVLIRDGREPEVTTRDAQTLERFAADARQVFAAVDGEDFDEAGTRVNGLLTWCRPKPQLDRFDGGEWHLHFHATPDDLGAGRDLAMGWVAGCAAAMAMAIGSTQAGRLGICAAPRCDRVYVDHSKNGTRRFCSTPCQNRVKNANHRRERNASRG